MSNPIYAATLAELLRRAENPEVLRQLLKEENQPEKLAAFCERFLSLYVGERKAA
jgi:hypothetical protein